MVKPKVKLEDVEEAAFIALYEEFMDDGENVVDAERLAKRFHSSVPLNVIRMALDSISNTNGSGRVAELTERRTSRSLLGAPSHDWESVPTETYRLTRHGYTEAQKFDDERYGFLKSAYLVDADDNQIEVSGELDNSDNWEPLPIDRDSKEFVEALGASEEAEKVIREDNGFATSHPEIRDHVVWSLGAGLNALKEGLMTTEQVRSLLIAPLNKVASMFAEGLIRGAANAAVKALLVWLKS